MPRLQIAAVEGLKENPAWSEALRLGKEHVEMRQNQLVGKGIMQHDPNMAACNMNYWAGMHAMLIFLGELPYNKSEKGEG